MRLTWTALVGIALAAGSARAKTPLEACYAASRDRLAVSACLERRVAESESALASALSAAERRMLELDAVSSGARAGAALAASQKAFIAYREANCAFAGAQLASGTGAGDVTRDCEIRMTDVRTRELGARAASAGPLPWQDVEWKLVRLVREHRALALVPGSSATVTFHLDGKVEGGATLNRFSGTYQTVDASHFTWTPPAFATTRMAGPPELMAQEDAFLAVLAVVTRIRVDGTHLALESEDRSAALGFER
ncbi:MAG: META domain-containing protein [Myxococcota bacterium]